MREIKFRAWDKILKRLLYWDEIKLFRLEVLEQNCPLILMQFTGLCDKNGKEIYEGDVIEYTYRDGWKEKLKIDFDPLKGYFAAGYTYRLMGMVAKGDTSDPDTKCIEVISNIYENPELLK